MFWKCEDGTIESFKLEKDVDKLTEIHIYIKTLESCTTMTILVLYLLCQKMVIITLNCPYKLVKTNTSYAKKNMIFVDLLVGLSKRIKICLGSDI